MFIIRHALLYSLVALFVASGSLHAQAHEPGAVRLAINQEIIQNGILIHPFYIQQPHAPGDNVTTNSHRIMSCELNIVAPEGKSAFLSKFQNIRTITDFCLPAAVKEDLEIRDIDFRHFRKFIIFIRRDQLDGIIDPETGNVVDSANIPGIIDGYFKRNHIVYAPTAFLQLVMNNVPVWNLRICFKKEIQVATKNS